MENRVSCSFAAGQKARNIRFIAQDLGLPLILVDVRHDSTHGALPSLALLERCRREALAWLRANYWSSPADRPTSESAAAAQLRRGELAPEPDGVLVRIERGALEELVALRTKRLAEPQGRDEDEEEHAVLLLPPVPRWYEGAPAGRGLKRTRLNQIASGVDF